MKTTLAPEEYDAFLSSYEAPAKHALRINTLKGSTRELLAASGFSLSPVPWEENGFYYPAEERPGKHVLHEAGAYYIQEPSAMLPATLLDAKPGELVLDLCAAPGGKTMQLAFAMRSEGLLVANEIHPARAKILSENVERCGVKNCIVLNESPDRLAALFPRLFDRILVDAPCSGEGMFRKNPEAALEWSLEGVWRCADRQKGILDAAAEMLAPGGQLVYSTCTFSREEDEEIVEQFLTRHADYFLTRQEKLLPHLVRGEGQFAAVLSLSGDSSDAPKRRARYMAHSAALSGSRKSISLPAELTELLSVSPRGERLLPFGQQLYALPEYAIPLSGLKVLRPGLCLGSYRKNRFEPSHALALSLKPEESRHALPVSPEEAASYIEGNPLSADTENGWVLLTVSGYSLAFGKASGGAIKNHYPKGLRKHL